ncbi:MAG: hypothetical protein WKF77_18330 [Planctomycetaceae bacterium]
MIVTNNGIELPITFRITDGFSTSGDNIVTLEKKKLDIYRQEQRLAYLGFPGGYAPGNALNVDGVFDDSTNWAMKVFSVATNPEARRPSVATSDTAYFKQNINQQMPHLGLDSARSMAIAIASAITVGRR